MQRAAIDSLLQSACSDTAYFSSTSNDATATTITDHNAADASNTTGAAVAMRIISLTGLPRKPDGSEIGQCRCSVTFLVTESSVEAEAATGGATTGTGSTELLFSDSESDDGSSEANGNIERSKFQTELSRDDDEDESDSDSGDGDVENRVVRIDDSDHKENRASSHDGSKQMESAAAAPAMQRESILTKALENAGRGAAHKLTNAGDKTVSLVQSRLSRASASSVISGDSGLNIRMMLLRTEMTRITHTDIKSRGTTKSQTKVPVLR
jgi:hypothetical protein